MDKKLKKYVMSETYTIEVSVNAFSEKEAEAKFDEILFNMERKSGKSVKANDVALYAHDETYCINESKID